MLTSTICTTIVLTTCPSPSSASSCNFFFKLSRCHSWCPINVALVFNDKAALVVLTLEITLLNNLDLTVSLPHNVAIMWLPISNCPCVDRRNHIIGFDVFGKSKFTPHTQVCEGVLEPLFLFRKLISSSERSIGGTMLKNIQKI